MNPKCIGIIGGIGCGKSFVSHVLATRFGVPIYDCDTRAKALMTEDAELMAGVRQLVGPEAYDAEGRLNRPLVAAYLFASVEHAAQINQLVHPTVRRDFRRWSQEQDVPCVGIESAILLESGLGEDVDAILMVEASEATRLERAMRRDAATEEQIRARMRHQRVEAMHEAATWILQNERETTEEDIYNQIKEKEIIC